MCHHWELKDAYRRELTEESADEEATNESEPETADDLEKPDEQRVRIVVSDD